MPKWQKNLAKLSGTFKFVDSKTNHQEREKFRQKVLLIF